MDLEWILGKAKVQFYASKLGLELPIKPDDLSTEDSEASSRTAWLLEICRRATPACELNPFLLNGHLQTFWTAIKGPDITIRYRRRIFESDDPRYAGSFAVDFASDADPSAPLDSNLPPRTRWLTEAEELESKSNDQLPMAILLHGLSGGSHEIYLRHVVQPLQDLGWQICVINSRGCAMSRITTPLLYNARATWDTRQLVKWLVRRYPNRPLFAVGFSLGANILVNYLGEEGSQCPLVAAVALSNPWNLEAGALSLQRTWIGREIYSKTMTAGMKEMFKRHVDVIHKGGRIDTEKVLAAKYLHEFDREVQVPQWGYPTEGSYYRDSSSIDSILAVRVPLFAINAADDPIAIEDSFPYQEVQQNPFVVFCTTSLGGHLAWFESGGSRWFVKPVVQYLQTMATNIDFAKWQKMRNDYEAANTPGEPDLQRGTFDPMRRKFQFPFIDK